MYKNKGSKCIVKCRIELISKTDKTVWNKMQIINIILKIIYNFYLPLLNLIISQKWWTLKLINDKLFVFIHVKEYVHIFLKDTDLLWPLYYLNNYTNLFINIVYRLNHFFLLFIWVNMSDWTQLEYWKLFCIVCDCCALIIHFRPYEA